MQLKDYQQKIINEIRDYCLQLRFHQRNPSKAYEAFWEAKNNPVIIGDSNATRPYQSSLQHNPPHICIKVPTAGGKTFLAINALQVLFEERSTDLSKLVVWLVPSEAIYTQTINNLKNPDHPYRQQLNVLFQHRVTIINKDEALQGIGFSPESIQEGVTILVMIFNSLRAKKKEDKKIYQENSTLSRFEKQIIADETIDDSSLSNALLYARPIVIIDEAHHTTSDLSAEMLALLAPDFILDLTATPKPKANIISYATAIQLKKENMVKLPVIVYNQKSRDAVLENAIKLQKQLEIFAIEEEKVTGNYIRPIVLLQAQGKGNDNDATQYNVLKKELMERGIPEDQIKIKIASIDELKGIEITRKDCPVRYIITINALQEGRDCPFAYILASVANKSSETDVTQILGRILRQPHTRQHQQDMLNACYVITSSNKFNEVLEKIVRSLNDSGYNSKLHYKNSSPLEQASFVKGIECGEAPSLDFNAKIPDYQSDNISKQENNQTASEQHTGETTNDVVLETMIQSAIQTIQENTKTVNATSNNALSPEEAKNMTIFPMKQMFVDEVKQIKIPQFHHCVPTPNDMFQPERILLIKKTDCLNGFDIQTCDSTIILDDLGTELSEVDVHEQGGEQFGVEYGQARSSASEKMKQYLRNQPKEVVIKMVVENIMRAISYQDEQYEKGMRVYLHRILSNLSNEQVEHIKEHHERFEETLKVKIKQLEREYSSSHFQRMIASNTFFMHPSFSFPDQIEVKISKAGIPKSLYEEEGDMNEFELGVIRKLADLPNIKRRHRNIERKGFFLNGRINHYPDFILCTTQGNIIIIETKGDDRDNSDSVDKLKLGKDRVSVAGSTYKYFMVFQQNTIEGSYTVDQVVQIIKSL